MLRLGKRLATLKFVRSALDVYEVHALLAQPSGSTSGLGPDVVVQLFHGVLGELFSSPWVVGLFALIALNAGIKTIRTIIHGHHVPDPQRKFSGAQRAVIFVRAGNRCEHHSWLLGRCEESGGLQADHIHPHSRGGATALENGQVLCRRLNKRKAARVPWDWELARLARRRDRYFPADTPRAVVRHRRAASPTING